MNFAERIAVKLAWKRLEGKMGANLKRYLPLAGTALLAAAVVLRALGHVEAAQAVETIGGLAGVTNHTVVPIGELAAAGAALLGVFLKVRSEVQKARG